MTQLGELRDAYPKFVEAGVKLYAVSYDDPEALSAFAAANDIPYPLLSDSDSAVIRQFGILNTEVEPHEAPFYGIPFPGTYVLDADGTVIDKHFPRHLANRESAEIILESALGKTVVNDSEPTASASDGEIQITARLHGGGGTIKSGILRRVIVRFELPNDLHIYGDKVADGMVSTKITVSGPEGLVIKAPLYPETQPLRLKNLDKEFEVWSGAVEISIPVWANSYLVDVLDEHRARTVPIVVQVRYQACNANTCLLPRTEVLTLDVPIEPLDVPNLEGLGFSAQRVTPMDSQEHLARLLKRFT